MLGIVPKTYLPTTHEYYEERWFSSSRDCPVDVVDLDGHTIPFGVDVLFHRPEHAALQSLASRPVKTSGRPIRPAARWRWRALRSSSTPRPAMRSSAKPHIAAHLVTQQSARCLAGYVYAGSGPGRVNNRCGVRRALSDRGNGVAASGDHRASSSSGRWR